MRLVSLLFLLLIFAGCANISSQESNSDLSNKIKGMNYTGPGNGPFGEEPFESMKDIGSNFVALVPEASLLQNTLAIRHSYNSEKAWYGESTVAILEGINQARKFGLKVMIKPHLEPGIDRSDWDEPDLNREDSLSRANYIASYQAFSETIEIKTRVRTRWRGDLMAKDDEGWEIMSKAYEEYILSYAVLADSMDVELFCIGTELKAMALEKPDYWKSLIRKVRAVYKGPITYAANWDMFDEITFWEGLDFVGIDAYFPLGDHKVPSIEETISEWGPYKKRMENFQRQSGKQVIFTEWGYESEEYAGKTPWKSEGAYHEVVQKNLYEATLRSFWDESWFAGVFVWRWSPNDEFKSGTYNFSPKGTLAQEVLEEWFKKQ